MNMLVGLMLANMSEARKNTCKHARQHVILFVLTFSTQGARRSQEEPGGARRSQEEPLDPFVPLVPRTRSSCWSPGLVGRILS